MPQPTAEAVVPEPNEHRNASTVPSVDRPADPAALYPENALTPELLALIRQAEAGGALITIITVQRPPQLRGRTAPTLDAPALTTEEAAAHYRVEPATIRTWCREGRFPGASRTGKSWRIPTPQAAPTGTRRPPPPPVPPFAPPADASDGPGTNASASARARNTADPDHAHTAARAHDGPDTPQVAPRSVRTPKSAARRATPEPKHPAFDPADLSSWRTQQ